MRRSILFACLTLGVLGLHAQDLNTISVPGIEALANGWYKFVSEGANYDVEITNGGLVKGNIRWFDTHTYSGDLSRNVISGKGTYTWDNGDYYEGAFKNNERSGKGTMHWKNGAKFSGKWKNNKRNGKGTLWEIDGTIVKGVWEEDVLVKKK
ncbi:hypothetical protein WIW50_11170 [Flavobacteriaceae bacterium 3-367]